MKGTGMLRDLLNLEDGMTGWEMEFVEAAARQVFDNEFPLSQNQFEKVKEIWRDRCK